jgi:predicted O-methyltransferase YrrM
MTEVFQYKIQSIYDKTKDISGWLLPEETEKLFELAHLHGDTILEIGTFRGRSAAVLNAGASSNTQRSSYQFYSIDIDPGSSFHAYEVLKPRGHEQSALFYHGTLKTFRKEIPITPTMVFVDGDHSYEGILSDLNELSTLLVPNTPIAFHDYLNPETPGVSRAVDQWIEAGFATKTGEYGCTAFLVTSQKCSAPPRRLSVRRFRKLHDGYLRRIGVLPSARGKIAATFPWLVPIVRAVRRNFYLKKS